MSVIQINKTAQTLIAKLHADGFVVQTISCRGEGMMAFYFLAEKPVSGWICYEGEGSTLLGAIRKAMKNGAY